MKVTVQELFEAGVHYGHQKRKWNPKSKSYIYSNVKGVSIIDLEKTLQLLENACRFLEKVVTNGGKVLYVGTKKQAQELIRENASSVEMPFCSYRWMGGFLTNFSTIQKSLAKYKRFLNLEANGELDSFPKKEASSIKREISRMSRNFEGVANLKDLPDALLVVDIKTEHIAISEARKKGIPVVAVVDTNSDPGLVDYPIPANDDAVKSIDLILQVLSDSIREGLEQNKAMKSQKAVSAEAKEDLENDENFLGSSEENKENNEEKI